MSVVRWNQNELGSTGEKELKGGPLPPTTLAAIESLAIPLVQEVVFLADFRCSGCQQRVAEIMSKMNGETQSVMVSILEKKVTLTCTYEAANKLPRGRQISSVHRTSLRKVCLIMRPFLSSCT
ncbi:uncharacterized protein LOC111396259 [Olea europaea var. sylvestris]|uniref:Uncharacterized protein LOC111396259 n=1 Tax=Olea europaea subsp. europaea TaxID=158383 RepID=A0A8S0U782_OLEEU|nr:uncharacterized protein LOC111396259 [Olea europaea var. sylvestris]CAA3014452.1 uncharacterized protein LOC111396259 [Olea europaea subsp. europaea]